MKPTLNALLPHLPRFDGIRTGDNVRAFMSFEAVTEYRVLCIGACYVDDRSAVPGESYWYTFEVEPSNRAPVTYGPSVCPRPKVMVMMPMTFGHACGG